MSLNKTDNLQNRVSKLEKLVEGPYLDVLIKINNPIPANTVIDIQSTNPDYTVTTPAPGFKNLMDTADEFYRNAKLQIYLDGVPQGKGVTRAVEWVSSTSIKFHGPLFPDMEIKIWFTPLSEDIYLTGALSAYQIALLHGFVGSEEEWLASLQAGGQFATLAEAQAGTNTTKLMNPKMTAEAIIAQLHAGNSITLTPESGGLRVDVISPKYGKYYFAPSAPVQGGAVFKVWNDLIAEINSLPTGTIPHITFLENFTIPSSGMPINGWDMKLGTWASHVIATGAVTVTIPDGVKVDNLNMIENGLAVICNPTTADGVFSNTILGSFQIMIVALGAKLANTGTKALINASYQVVFVLNGATMDIPPISTGPLVKQNTSDVILAISFGESPNTLWPDNWVIGGITGSLIMYIHGVTFEDPSIPGWTGDAPIYIFSARAKNVEYNDSVQLPTSGAGTVQEALDWLKTQIGMGGGGLTVTSLKTSNYTATANESIPIDTNGGIFTITLPGSPAHGDRVEIFDAGGFTSTNPATIARNGNNINGAASDVLFNVDYEKVLATFITGIGWIID